MTGKPPLRNASFAPPKFSRFDTLPVRLQSKIDREKVSGCWIWTAYTAPGRTRPRAYRSHENFNGFRHTSHYRGYEKPAPIVQDPFKKKPRPANRVVYGILTGTYVDDVPKLERCRNPLCVNPKHMNPIGPSPNRGQFSERSAFEAVAVEAEAVPAVAEAEAEADANVDVLAVLKEKRPLAELGEAEFPLIEAECGLPAGSITAPIWAAYVLWDEENPEP